MGEEQRASLDKLISRINDEVRETCFITSLKELPASVIQAMRDVPRALFVPDVNKVYALQNVSLPIGYEQTISQPFIVALMTGLINPGTRDVVLEIGTGSGYQTAILSKLAHKVYSVELIKPLSVRAQDTLDSLGIKNVELKCGDGAEGWAAHAPFDAIIVTAAVRRVPRALLDQLKDNGRMIIPVGPDRGEQYLHLITKDGQGRISDKQILPVSFVPLLSRWAE